MLCFGIVSDTVGLTLPSNHRYILVIAFVSAHDAVRADTPTSLRTQYNIPLAYSHGLLVLLEHAILPEIVLLRIVLFLMLITVVVLRNNVIFAGVLGILMLLSFPDLHTSTRRFVLSAFLDAFEKTWSTRCTVVSWSLLPRRLHVLLELEGAPSLLLAEAAAVVGSGAAEAARTQAHPRADGAARLHQCFLGRKEPP